MPGQISWEGFDELAKKLRRLRDPDASDLMEDWERVIVEDHRRGVLAGLDKDDQPMPPLKYRGGRGAPTKGRKKSQFGTVKHPNNPGSGGNLSTSQYRKLTGPRLAPRGEESRVITNLHTGHGRDAKTNAWFAVGAWDRVVSKKGVPFLMFHFNGEGRLPRYDLRGVRPEGFRQAVQLLRQWITRQISRP
jgi:hypothetical protein